MPRRVKAPRCDPSNPIGTRALAPRSAGCAARQRLPLSGCIGMGGASQPTPVIRLPSGRLFAKRKSLNAWEREVVSLTFASWNQVTGWLRRLEGLWAAA